LAIPGFCSKAVRPQADSHAPAGPGLDPSASDRSCEHSMLKTAIAALLLAALVASGPAAAAASHVSAEGCKAGHQSCRSGCEATPHAASCLDDCRSAYKQCLTRALEALKKSTVGGG
jgi:hypothetical protein